MKGRCSLAIVGGLLAACASQGGRTGEQDLEARIREIARAWGGTPYRAGGSSRRGTDCSGFTHTVFAQEFGVEIPRTSRDQARAGDPVDRDDLTAGDLVFFDLRAGRKGIDHVGLYVGEGLFVHARPRRGVGLDRLDEPVFRRGYRGARRVPLR